MEVKASAPSLGPRGRTPAPRGSSCFVAPLTLSVCRQSWDKFVFSYFDKREVGLQKGGILISHKLKLSTFCETEIGWQTATMLATRLW